MEQVKSSLGDFQSLTEEARIRGHQMSALDVTPGADDMVDGVIDNIYSPKFEEAKNEYKIISELPMQYLISEELLSNIDYERINREYINDLAKITREIQNSNFSESQEYDAQVVKSCSVGYIENLIIYSIDEDVAACVKDNYMRE